MIYIKKIYHFYWTWDIETSRFWQCKHNLTTYRAPCRWFIKAETVPDDPQAKWEVVPQPRNQQDNSFNLLPAPRPHHSQPQLARQTNLQHLKGQYVIRISTIGCYTRTDPALDVITSGVKLVMGETDGRVSAATTGAMSERNASSWVKHSLAVTIISPQKALCFQRAQGPCHIRGAVY